jgi:hypothetical protein
MSSVHQVEGRAVLGVDMVTALNTDIARTVLPSWVSSGPKSFDASEHGKLSASEWRTTILIRLIITLPPIWGPRPGRPKLMLDNFMHLANAVVIASTRAVVVQPSSENGAIQSTADLYHKEYSAYLLGRVQLYPTGKIQPTEHIAYHIGQKLGQYGPVHNTSTNAMERFNGMIQNQPTNMRSGK